MSQKDMGSAECDKDLIAKMKRGIVTGKSMIKPLSED